MPKKPCNACQFTAVVCDVQATQFFQEWARICNTPGGTNDKAYAIYISQLQSTGMLKGDDITDRFFRILLVRLFSFIAFVIGFEII